MGTVAGWISTCGGLLLFGVAWFAHKKQLTRFACILAALAGVATYGAVVGSALNKFLAQIPMLLAAGVLVGIVVIVADIKGKKKGADKPALVSFFLVPLFLVAFVLSLPVVIGQIGDGFGKVGDQITTQIDEEK